jgi:hypothetical protein
LGSVCRRQSTTEIAVIVTALARRGLRLHGFGVKTGGLHLYGHLLASARLDGLELRHRLAPPRAALPRRRWPPGRPVHRPGLATSHQHQAGHLNGTGAAHPSGAPP